MSKRRLEGEIDEVSDEILEDLSPDKRLQLVLESRAEGNEQEVDQLMKSCPRYEVTVKDREFINRLRLAQQYVNHAICGLYTAYLQYELVVQRLGYQWQLDEERDRPLSDMERDRVGEQCKNRCALLVRLYTSYHAHRRFATEVLEVDLKTWVAQYPGSIVINAVASVIDDRERIELANADLKDLLEKEESEAGDSDQAASDSEPMTLDDRVEILYEILRQTWETMINQSSDWTTLSHRLLDGLRVRTF